MIAVCLAYQRVPYIVHFLYATCEYRIRASAHRSSHCVVEFRTSSADHFNQAKPLYFVVRNVGDWHAYCVVGDVCIFDKTTDGQLEMCTFEPIALAARLDRYLRIPKRVGDIYNYNVMLTSLDCGAEVVVSAMRYGQAAYSISFLLQFMGFTVLLHVAALYSGVRALAFLFSNYALVQDIPLDVLTVQINYQEILIFIIEELASRQRDFKRLHHFLTFCGICIQVPSMVITTVAIIRANGFRDLISHQLRLAVKLSNKMSGVLLFISVFIGLDQRLHFVFMQMLLFCPFFYFVETDKRGQAHNYYSQYLILDVLRCEAVLMYYYGFANYAQIKTNRFYAATAYCVGIIYIWALMRRRAIYKADLHHTVYIQELTYFNDMNYQEFLCCDGYAIAVRDGAQNCQNCWHMHQTSDGVLKYRPAYLRNMNLTEFDTRCYAVVSYDFFSQQCAICLDVLNFALDQLCVCKSKKDSIYEREYLTTHLGVDATHADTVYLKCGHLFHKECMLAWLSEQRTCPKCRRQVY